MMVTLEKIAKAEILDSNSCNTILDILSRTQDALGLRRLIPENVMIEHKTGELSDVCHDVGIVRIPDKPMIICVMIKGANLVQRWDAIAEIGRLFYDFASHETRERER
jgi:beta-lactamase class A